MRLLVNQSQEDIEELIKVNLLSTININEVVKFMIIKNEGRIINISSIVASSGYKGTAVYSLQKALLGFTKSLSRELAKENIKLIQYRLFGGNRFDKKFVKKLLNN